MINCKTCGKPFQREIKRGRPAVRCQECRTKDAENVPFDLKELHTDDAIIQGVESEEVSIPKKEVVKENASLDTSESASPDTFVLMVGNMGKAHGGNNEQEAVIAFDSYARKSSMGFGQVGFETVQLWKLNVQANSYELHKEYRHQKDL